MNKDKWDKLNKELDDALDAEFGSEEPKQETLEERIQYIAFLHKQNLNGRETEDELFEAGILAGIKETLEEAAESYSKRSNASVFQENHKRDFISGAKWQQQQMEKLKDFDTWKEWKNTGIIKIK